MIAIGRSERDALFKSRPAQDEGVLPLLRSDQLVSPADILAQMDASFFQRSACHQQVHLHLAITDDGKPFLAGRLSVHLIPDILLVGVDLIDARLQMR